ncbi:MAG: TetR family transcriptional regulator [Chloroflexi bacterium]|nr:TetR family transcriptional regulator [Chloroflexota bacterium]
MARSARGSGPARRQAIIDEAIRLMHAKGYAATSIQDVANQFDFTKAAFYYYVKNKEELLYEVLLQTLQETVERISQIVNRRRLSPAAKLDAIVLCYVELMAERPAVFSVYFQERAHLSPEHYQVVTELEQRLLEMIQTVYRKGRRSGQLQDLDPTVAVFGLLGACFWVYKWFRADGRLSANEIASMLQALLAKGYASR